MRLDGAIASVAGDLAHRLVYDGETLVGSSMLRVLPGVGYLPRSGGSAGSMPR
ncbi:hypothetical protein [Paraliomyxa miuraensis]|uniref:hypothetical protein n=1 Tax=Paraliomyxa miuraensis TaxID=376150 RepID=UPI002259EA66|nr:hypothetical protein [Paraliomyxa miuraensis]MCX4239602.1 hypothetical protein [Paraliomyxa miuraensis]